MKAPGVHSGQSRFGPTATMEIALPQALAVGADYGLTVINGAPPAAEQFAQFILSSAGQSISAGFGFAPSQPER